MPFLPHFAHFVPLPCHVQCLILQKKNTSGFPNRYDNNSCSLRSGRRSYLKSFLPLLQCLPDVALFPMLSREFLGLSIHALRFRSSANRVWKGILGIRDLAKIRCGIRENAKYLDGILDLTSTRKAGFAKIWARDSRFFCLSFGDSGNRHDPINVLTAKANQPGERKISIETTNLHLKFISFCRN